MNLKFLEKKFHYDLANTWFEKRHWKPFPFQKETWDAFLSGQSGLLNAPTGSGKTYALWIASVLELLENQQFNKNQTPEGLKIIWITPLRALAKDIQKALKLFCEDLGISWQILIRTGDTPSDERVKQLRKAPTCLITTPESLHILFSQKQSVTYFSNTTAIIVDEWHELMGTKRGVQTELAVSRIKILSKNTLKIWGISATIGNLEEAVEVLLGPKHKEKPLIVRKGLQFNP